ncbi:MAG: hypothetical protein IT374_08590 [Polyangiaceae bacterium]|nr:hypothetical protein [Polyangiaceae bacterium]
MTQPLAHALDLLATEVAFATLASEKADPEVWGELASRREEAHRAAVAGAPALVGQEAIAVALSRALAPTHAPRFLPMHELADAVGLAGGARGLKSLFTSKPSDKDLARVRAIASGAMSVAASSMAANGALTVDERSTLRAAAACFGLSAEDEALIAGVPALPADTAPVPAEIDAKSARAIVRGAWLAAIQDGLDVPDEGAVALLANRMGIAMEETGAIGADVKKLGDARHALAKAAVQATTLVARDDLPRVAEVCELVAWLGVPSPYRAAVLAPLATGATPEVSEKAADKHARGAALAIAWAAALRGDPPFTRRAVLAARHDHAAKSLGAEDDGARVRELVDRHVERALARLAGA